jgi:hypothetical protein
MSYKYLLSMLLFFFFFDMSAQKRKRGFKLVTSASLGMVPADVTFKFIKYYLVFTLNFICLVEF